MTEKHFTIEKVLDIIFPLFLIELFIFANIVLISLILTEFGVF